MQTKIWIDITERCPFADGTAFGDTGSYERLRGRVRFAVDPNAPAQAAITDLDKAPTNSDGLVEFTADFCILKPANPKKANGRLFYDYGNRGNARALQFFNDAPGSNAPISTEHAGNGFLFRRGYTVLWAAWQGDLLPGGDRLMLDLPTAINGDGTPVTGRVRSEFVVDTKGVDTLPVSGFISTRGHPSVSMDTSDAQLTRRRYPQDKRQLINSSDWAFARTETGPGMDGQGTEEAVIPSAVHIYKPDGFEPGWIYELVYEGRDPLVMGLGHIVVRDLVSFFKYEAADSAGTQNPLSSGPGLAIIKAYSWGRSQTGRAIRDSIYQGFNGDSEGRKVFDGVLAHVAGAGRMWLNHRFAIGTSAAGQQYEAHDNPADRFPFAYGESTDHVTGKTDAILKRPDTDPLVMHSQTGTEYWQRRGSLVHTDTHGNDLEPPEGVRIYLWSSSQHFASPLADRPKQGVCQNLPNIVRTSMLFRAMLDALDAWASDGVRPPDSQFPKRADGSLVSFGDWRRKFPEIPGINLPAAANGLSHLDFGADLETGILPQFPPHLIEQDAYTVLVPAVDEDGNDIAGVRAPMVTAPLATYTGWNTRSEGHGEGALHWFTGSTINFPETKEQCDEAGDPRLSILERYGDSNGYVKAIETAARELEGANFILEEDVIRCCEHAKNWDQIRSRIRSLTEQA